MKKPSLSFATGYLTRCTLIAFLTLPAFAQVHHSGEHSDDFTMVSRVTSPLPETTCPPGQIAVGSTCVPVPITSPPITAWTAQVPTETRCGVVNDGGWISYTGSTVRAVLDLRNFCVMMNADGAGSVSGYNYNFYYFYGTVSSYLPPGSAQMSGTGQYQTNPNAKIYTDIDAYFFGTLVLTPTLTGNSVSGWEIQILPLPCTGRGCPS